MKRIEYKDVKFYFSDIRTKEHIFSLLSFLFLCLKINLSSI